jgi:hypothetical protein
MSIAAAVSATQPTESCVKRLMGFPISPAHQSSAFFIGPTRQLSMTLDAKKMARNACTGQGSSLDAQ